MSVVRATNSPQAKATRAKVSGMLSDGKWHRCTASVYGRADSGGLPACGGSLSGHTWFAELDSGQGLGGLPCGTKIDVKGPNGHVLTMPKRDRNSTNNLPGVSGTRRLIDIWKENGAPEELGISGLGLVEVRLSTGDATGDSFGGDSATTTVAKRYEFTRGEKGGKRENSWDAMGRLAEEVAWSRWAAQNVLGYASQDELIAGPPGVELDGDEGFVLDEPQWSWNPNRPVEELTLHVAADRWEVMPGGVVLFTAGRPFDGRWLVSNVSGESLDSPIVEVTFKRPTHKKPEPAPETTTRTTDTGDAGAGGAAGGDISSAGGARGIVESAVKIAKTVSSSIIVVSDYRPGDTVSGGSPSDHSGNDSSRAARDIGKQGVDALAGPPPHELDNACVLIGAAFGKHYSRGQTVDADTFGFRGFRVQIIWRTPKYGGHMGHIHVGARRA